jgi:hypothetical protein
MTAVNGGSNRFVSAVLWRCEVQGMYLLGPHETRIWTDSNRNFTLRQYGRLEYGSPDVAWLVALAPRSQRRRKQGGGRFLAVRLRYFLNSFRGFAAFDLHRDETGH